MASWRCCTPKSGTTQIFFSTVFCHCYPTFEASHHFVGIESGSGDWGSPVSWLLASCWSSWFVSRLEICVSLWELTAVLFQIIACFRSTSFLLGAWFSLVTDAREPSLGTCFPRSASFWSWWTCSHCLSGAWCSRGSSQIILLDNCLVLSPYSSERYSWGSWKLNRLSQYWHENSWAPYSSMISVSSSVLPEMLSENLPFLVLLRCCQ